MKKVLFSFISIILFLSVLSSIRTEAASNIKVIYNGNPMTFDVNPVIENGTTLVEFKTLFNALGININYEPKTKKVSGVKDRLKIELTLGSKTAYINGQKQILEVPAKVVDGRTLVPLRFVGQSTGADIKWDGKNRIVTINNLDEEDSNNKIEDVPNNEKYLKEIPMLKIGETYTDGQIEVTVEKVEYINNGVNDGFKIYFEVFNKSNNTLENEGGFQFRLKQSLYEDEVNELGYGIHFNKMGYIYPNEKRTGYFYYLYNREIEIKEIQYHYRESGILKEPISKWIVDKSIVIDEKANGNKSEGTMIEEDVNGDAHEGNITSTQELQSFLNQNYSTLETVIGSTNFTFNILENDRTYIAYDYWIQVKYEYEFFEGAMSSTKYTREQKDTLFNQLKEHQKNLAEAVISKMSNKKFYGGYYDSWYKYPNLRVDLQTRRYLSWTNYDQAPLLEFDEYYATKPSTFRWYDFIDDTLLR